MKRDTRKYVIGGEHYAPVLWRRRLWCDHVGHCCSVRRRSVLMNLMIGGSTTHATAYHPLPITLITHPRLPKHKGRLYKDWPVPSPIELEAMHDFYPCLPFLALLFISLILHQRSAFKWSLRIFLVLQRNLSDRRSRPISNKAHFHK